MKPAPLNINEIPENNKMNIKDLQTNKNENYQLALDYYSKDNPFKKIIIGSTGVAVGSYSAAIIALGYSGAYISGGILFYDTAFVLCGYGAIAGTIGLAIGIPAIVGGISYAIYKFVKSGKLKDYMKRIADKNDESAKEEREILVLLTKECIDYFKNWINSSFIKKLKNIIQNDVKDIIKMIKENKKNENDEIKNKIRNEIYDMNFINILLIGGTGVGKSTLINEFLQLKEHTAQEGNTAEPQKIENWPKKYPVLPHESSIIGINLYDTEGIEKTGENNYDVHLKKIIDFIHSPNSDLKNKINAIWYCISSNRLDGDEKYINKILDLFTELKIPIIFVYTKAYSSKEDEIDMIKEGLQNFKYFKENPKKYYFIPVIAKDVKSKKTGNIIENKMGLNDLLETTKTISYDTIMAPFMKKISDEFNKSSMELIKKFSEKLQEQYDEIISKHDKSKTFKKKFYAIFETVYGEINDDIKYLIEHKIEGWMNPLESLEKEDLKNAIKNYDKHYLINRIETELLNKYNEKIKRNDTLPEDKKYKYEYKDFKEEIKDYLITQINNSKDIYGLYSLFDMARDSLLEIILEDLEDGLNKIKADMTNELQGDINKKIEEFAQKLMK